MKKAGILMLALLLVAAMFTGCRRREPNTTNSTHSTVTPTSTHSTSRATVPSTSGHTRPSTGIIPDATDLMPDTTDGTDMTRAHRGPRY